MKAAKDFYREKSELEAQEVQAISERQRLFRSNVAFQRQCPLTVHGKDMCSNPHCLYRHEWCQLPISRVAWKEGVRRGFPICRSFIFELDRLTLEHLHPDFSLIDDTQHFEMICGKIHSSAFRFAPLEYVQKIDAHNCFIQVEQKSILLPCDGLQIDPERFSGIPRGDGSQIAPERFSGKNQTQAVLFDRTRFSSMASPPPMMRSGGTTENRMRQCPNTIHGLDQCREAVSVPFSSMEDRKALLLWPKASRTMYPGHCHSVHRWCFTYGCQGRDCGLIHRSEKLLRPADLQVKNEMMYAASVERSKRLRIRDPQDLVDVRLVIPNQESSEVKKMPSFEEEIEFMLLVINPYWRDLVGEQWFERHPEKLSPQQIQDQLSFLAVWKIGCIRLFQEKFFPRIQFLYPPALPDKSLGSRLLLTRLNCQILISHHRSTFSSLSVCARFDIQSARSILQLPWRHFFRPV